MSHVVLYDVDQGVAKITLNRAEVLNALSSELVEALIQTIGKALADDSVRAVLITGAGRGFCSGADLSRVPVAGEAPIDPTESLEKRFNPLILSIRHATKPVVTAVNGVAAGAGMSLAVAGDIILAGQSASFIQVFARIGLIPDAGSTWLLPRLIGEQRARAMMMLAAPLNANDAKAAGLVWEVYADDELQAQAMRLAAKLAQGPTQTYGLVKQALDASNRQTLPGQLSTEVKLQKAALQTSDAREGIGAFLQKRPAQFKGN